MRRLLLLLLVPVLLTGCPGQWIKIDDSAQLHKTDRYTVNLPVNWVSLYSGDTLTVTRDGPGIQKITVQASAHKDAFSSIETASNSNMLPTELADLFIAELKKEDADGLPSLRILSNEPDRISGRDAFHIHASYRTANGLDYELLAVGFVTEKHFYVISYTAPRLVFFERNRETYDQILSSLKAI